MKEYNSKIVVDTLQILVGILKKHHIEYRFLGSDMETLVRVEFKKVSDDETEIILTQSGFDEEPTETDLKNNWTSESHTGGWTRAFSKLGKLVINT